MLYHKLHPDPFHLQTSPQLFLPCHQMKTHEKISWRFFSTSLQSWELYVNKNVHAATQQPSLGSMIAGPTCTPDISLSVPRFG